MKTLLGPKGYKPIIFTSPNVGNVSPRTAREIERQMSLPHGSYKDFHNLSHMAAREKALETAWHVVKGRFGKDQVLEVENGFRIFDYSLAEQMHIHLNEDQKAADAGRITLLSDLSGLGFEVGLITPDPMKEEFLDLGFIYAAKNAGVPTKNIVYVNSKQDMNEVSVSFLRDCFTQIGKTVFINEDARSLSWNELKDRAPGLNWKYSRLGFGGEFVVAGKFAFMSNMSKEQLNLARHSLNMNLYQAHMAVKTEAKKQLEQMGRTVFTLPPIWTDIIPPSVMKEIGTEKRIFTMMDHPDFIVLYPYLDNAIFFDRTYYKEHRDLIRRMLDIIKPKRFATLPDEDGLPLNSMRLPFGGVYMDAAAERSTKVVQSSGVKAHVSSIPFGAFRWGLHGGINCSTNIIWTAKS